MMLTRRALLRVVGSGAGVALLAACGQTIPIPATTPTSATGPAQTAPAAQTGSGGKLKLGVTAELPNLESHQMSPSTFNVVYQVHDRLIEYDANRQPVGQLVESWEFSPDRRQVTFKLRQGVKFHTGREFTSADIAPNVKHAADPKTGIGNLSVMSQWITDVQTPDKYTAVLVTEQPRPSLFDYLQFLNITDPETMQGPDAKTKIVGTGPYSFVEWAQGDHVTLRKNANYWKSGTPKLDEQDFHVFSDPQAMVAQLEASAIDGVIAAPLRDLARLKDDPNYRYFPNQAAGTYTLMVANTTQPPLDRKEARQAINYALNRKRVADSVYLGLYGAPKVLPWTPQNPAYDAARNGAYSYDLEKAKSLLQQAGVTGAQFDMIMPAGSAEYASVAQIVQSDLATLGIQLGIKPLETAAFNQAGLSKQGFGLIQDGSLFAQLLPSAITVLSTFYQPTAPKTGLVSDQYTQLVNQLGVELDPAKQKALYDQLNDFLIDQSHIMPLVATIGSVLARANLNGVGWMSYEGIDMRGASLS
jgi:peptide/nickel transport system substrate-binding protein